MAPQLQYHKKAKILSLRLSKKRSADSDVQGNVVVDYDVAGRVVNVDVMSVNLNNFVPARQLSDLAIKVVAE